MDMEWSKRQEAYIKAKEAAELDFASALNGLLAGNASQIERLQNEAQEARFAMTCAIGLASGSVRGDIRGVMIERVSKQIGNPSCGYERDFIEKLDKKP